MGTSGDRELPTNGGWPNVKRHATEFGKDDGASLPPGDLFRNYLAASGGPGGMAGGGLSSRGVGRSGGGSGGARPARSTGRQLGSFLSSVRTVGLTETLHRFGLGDLVGRPAGELRSALLDHLAGPGSTIDEASARWALSELEREMLGDAETYEDAEAALSEAVTEQGVVVLIVRFFALYLFDRFCRDFYAHLLERVGAARAVRALDRVKAYIMSCLNAKIFDRDLIEVDWAGAEGDRLVQDVLRETLDVFGVQT